MYILILFFMLIVPIQKDLPAVVASSPFEQYENLRVTVNNKSKIYFNGKRIQIKEIPEYANIESMKLDKDHKTVIELRLISK